MNYTLGQVVSSIAGRDAGKRFIVVKIVNESYVLISDGDLRRIEKPKKKKVKHLKFTGEIIDFLNEKLEKKAKITNTEIKRALEVTLDE